MSGIERFFILFERPPKAYFSGETVTGTVEIRLTEFVKLNEVTIRLLGEANVHWTETHRETELVRGANGRTTTRHRTRTVTYSNSEAYFDCKIPLWRPDGVNNGGLPAGSHSFYFSLCLPPHIPSSFEGSVGNVRYSAEAIFNVPWRLNKKCKVPFFVTTVYNLNLTQAALEPVTNIGEKYLCCCCCQSGPISVIASTDRRGYVPGDLLQVNVEVANHSNEEVKSTRITFQSVVEYHARTKTRSETNDLITLTRGRIEAGKTDVWSCDPIQVPPLPPTGLEFCRIIDIFYLVKVTVVPSGISSSFDVILPITIGTIPISTGPVSQVPPMPLPTAPELTYDDEPPPYDSVGTSNPGFNYREMEENPAPVHNYATKY